jgi:hypothetical protein
MTRLLVCFQDNLFFAIDELVPYIYMAKNQDFTPRSRSQAHEVEKWVQRARHTLRHITAQATSTDDGNGYFPSCTNRDAHTGKL